MGLCKSVGHFRTQIRNLAPADPACLHAAHRHEFVYVSAVLYGTYAALETECESSSCESFPIPFLNIVQIREILTGRFCSFDDLHHPKAISIVS